MSLLHTYLGLVTAAAFLVAGIWGIAAWARNRDPGAGFWRLIAAGQVGIGIQVVIGIVLFALGGRRHWLHYAYGGFPILVMIFVHRFSPRLKGIEWVAFAFAGLVIFGLIIRAYMTGVVG